MPARSSPAAPAPTDKSLVFDAALAAGATRADALTAVVDWLIGETVRGVADPG